MLKLLEQYIDAYYYKSDEVTAQQRQDGMYKGLLESLGDVYSCYYTPEELNDLVQQTEGVYYGIGAYVSKDVETGACVISGVIRNSPAEAAELMEGDIISKGDDEDMLGQFMICRVLMAFDQQKNVSQLIYLASVKEDQSAEEVYENAVNKMQELAEKLYQPIKTSEGKTTARKEKVDFLKKYGKMPESFAKIIEKCKEYIIAGDIFQVVPSCQFREKLTKPAFHFYRRLRQVNPSPYMFYLNFGKKKFVAASPEMLVKVAGQYVYTYPIAGTRRRGATEAEDKELAVELKADIKECAEHSMLVDLARNDIGRISEPGSVVVTKLREVERFSHVMHMVSEVMGTLKTGITPMEVLKGCFPAGTVSGAPKLRAMEIIRELEPVQRGAYSGTVGYMDFCGNMDMCITLRTMIIDGDNAFIQSGAGIVYDSKADFEYNEILQKSKAMFKVVEEVENDVVTFR